MSCWKYLHIRNTVKQFGVKIGKIPENCAVTGCGRNKNKEIVSLRFIPVVFDTSYFFEKQCLTADKTRAYPGIGS